MKLLIATENPGKEKELKAFLPSETFSPILTLKDLARDIPSPEEKGKSYEENALLKARYYGKASGLPTLAEDSGVEIKALPGLFGLKTRRTIEAKSDEEWLEAFLKMMEGKEDRQATFYSAIAFFDPTTQREAVFLGTITGTLTEKPQAQMEKGIPLSCLFLPEGEKEVFSAMPPERKFQISHRGQAFKQFLTWISDHYV